MAPDQATPVNGLRPSTMETIRSRGLNDRVAWVITMTVVSGNSVRRISCR